MKQEEKQLLLKDLSARLTYRVKCYIDNTIPPIPSYSDYENGEVITKPVTVTGLSCENKMKCIEIDDKNIDGVTIEKIKIYLRPMSSMTEEERKAFEAALGTAWQKYRDGARLVDRFEDNYIECAFSKGFLQGYIAAKQTSTNIKDNNEKVYQTNK